MPANHSPTTCPALLHMLSLPDSDEAWREFVDRYSPMIEDRCRRAGLQPADAEDVRAAVCFRLVQAMKGFRYDPARRFRGYLKRVVDNVVNDHWRAPRARPGWIGRGGDPDDPTPEPLASLGADLDEEIGPRVDEFQRALDRVRFEVGPENWRVFEMTALEGLSGAEAAERLGKTATAVYVTKSRVLNRLRVEAGAGGG